MPDLHGISKDNKVIFRYHFNIVKVKYVKANLVEIEFNKH